MQTTTVERSVHGHHKVAAALFVSSLILGAAMIMSAEIAKPERYEFHAGADATSYILYDRDTGRATRADFNAKDPKAALGN